MELRSLRGETWVIETDLASIGVYRFPDQSCLLIDSGTGSRQAQAILHGLTERDWSVRAIFNTHAHSDHCGGDHFLQQKTHCPIYASAIEAVFIENPLLHPYTLYGGFPPRLLQGRFFMPQPAQVTVPAIPGITSIHGQEFEILDLGGHTLGHLGIRTPDDVVFTGDSLTTAELLTANPFLYLAHPAHQCLTLDKIEAAAYDSVYLSHGGWQDEAGPICRANRSLLVYILDCLLEVLQKPRSLEEVTAAMIARQGLDINRNHYFRLAGTISAYLAYLCNQGQAKLYTDNSRLLYSRKTAE